jgi:hypothetical protein|tara:strand:+ start:419 stop:691 length:273 start_codon:yes stop_codon:yes gene_type:complete
MIHVTLTAAGHEVLEAEGGGARRALTCARGQGQEESRDEEKEGGGGCRLRLKPGWTSSWQEDKLGVHSGNVHRVFSSNQIVGATSGATFV